MHKASFKPDTPIFVAGHRGMVGSAVLRCLKEAGFTRLITRTRSQLDLTDQVAVNRFFDSVQVDHVVLAAARVGGILANNSYPAEFIYQNLMIEANVIQAALQAGIRHLLFLGSSCIYPKHAAQPMTETALLTGTLEPTNEPYAIAKIAGIKLCEAFNRQYGTDYRAVMPTNLYGPNDNFDLLNSHVLPALIRKFHLARLAAEGNRPAIEADEALFGPIPEDIRRDLQAIEQGDGAVRLWGSGRPRREFLHVDDLAAACLQIMRLSQDAYGALCSAPDPAGSEEDDRQTPVSFINVGTGRDLTIEQLARMVSSVVGYSGPVIWDQSRPDGTPRKLLDVTRLKKTGWKPKISLERGIGSVYDWYQKQAVHSKSQTD